MPQFEYPQVGFAHPQGMPLPDSLIERVHAAVTEKTDVETADAVVRFLQNTSTTTVRRRAHGDTFVMTGDIPAMWLRDSSAQLSPLLRLLKAWPEETELASLIGGLVRIQWSMILVDPYANAFNEAANGNKWDEDEPATSPWVWERKWEIDSLAYPLDLAARLNSLGSREWISEETLPAIATILDVLETELDHENNSSYFFRRQNCPEQDTLVRDGKGRLTEPCGLVWQGFRPSDDACSLGYNVPGNAFMASALRGIDALVSAAHEEGHTIAGLDELATRADKLRTSIIGALGRHAIMTLDSGERVLAYEVDGMGNELFLDDANVPSLLSLPYLDVIDAADPLYERTRNAVLSPANPYYFEGAALQGVGSAHTPDRYVWPIALAVEGLTSQSDERRRNILRTLLDTTGGTGYMHEGVDCDNPTAFTREWFSWSNSMFCELALEVAGLERPSAFQNPALIHLDADA